MTPATDHRDESARLLRSGPLSHTGLIAAINAQVFAMIQTDPSKVVECSSSFARCFVQYRPNSSLRKLPCTLHKAGVGTCTCRGVSDYAINAHLTVW